jgi:hypothetical protein
MFVGSTRCGLHRSDSALSVETTAIAAISGRRLELQFDPGQS